VAMMCALKTGYFRSQNENRKFISSLNRFGLAEIGALHKCRTPQKNGGTA
jgi:hypothetical protein